MENICEIKTLTSKDTHKVIINLRRIESEKSIKKDQGSSI